MDGTEGLIRGQKVTDLGSPITIPVGPETLGRIMNVIGELNDLSKSTSKFECNLFYFLLKGEPIDERGPISTDKFAAIHAEAPEFTQMSVEQEILVTGIKVVDLLAPYAKGGKIGRFCERVKMIELKALVSIYNKCKYNASIPWFFLLQACSGVLVSEKLY